MFLFPIAGPNVEGIAGAKPFKGEGLKLLLRGLVRFNEAFKICLHAKALSVGPFAKPRLYLWVDGDSHRLMLQSFLRWTATLAFVTVSPHMIACVVPYPFLPARFFGLASSSSLMASADAAGFFAMARLCFSASIISTTLAGSWKAGATTS